MNTIASNRVFNPLMTLACVATIIVITAISIQMLYGVFQFIEMLIREVSGRSGQYFSQLVKAIN